MVKNMQRKEIEPGIINWIANALINRQAIATLNGELVMKMVNRGTEPIMTYSCFTWINSSNKSTHMKKLGKGLKA